MFLRNKILFILVMSFLGLLPLCSKAEEVAYHPFTLNCNAPEAFDVNHGILIPNGATKIDKIYLYFHGLNKSGARIDVQSLVSKYELGQKVETMRQKGINIAIIIPQLNPKSGNNSSKFNNANFKCFIDGAKSELKRLIPQSPSDIAVVAGHSAGGGVIYSFFASGFFPTESTVLLDACYPGWCPSIVQNGRSGKVYIYYSASAGTEKGSREAYEAAPDKTVLYKLKTDDHEGVAKSCFLDHYLNDSCGGNAELVSGTPGGAEISVTSLAEDFKPTLPSLSIKIPGVNFSELTAVINEGENSYILIPWLGEYITAIYNFAMVIASILAVILLILEGTRVVISGGGEAKNTAYKRIAQIVVGLVIVWGSYAILYTINPDLVNFRALKVAYIVGITLGEDEDPASSQETNAVSAVNVSADLKSIIPTNSNACFPVPRDTIDESKGGVALNSFGDFRGPLKDGSTAAFRCHAGNDIFVKNEADVLAIDDGVVVNVIRNFSQCKDRYAQLVAQRKLDPKKASNEGYAVIVYHEHLGPGYTINYGEIDNDTSKFKPPKKGEDFVPVPIKKGESLGKVGYCGMLHLEVYKGEILPEANTDLFWKIPDSVTASFLMPANQAKQMALKDLLTTYRKTGKLSTFKTNCRTVYRQYAEQRSTIMDPRELLETLQKNPCTKP